MKTLRATLWFALGISATAISQIAAQGTSFTYQGRLNASSQPANGTYNFSFLVFDVPVGGVAIGSTVITNNVPVSNGLFTVTLNFGFDVFTGNPRWLSIAANTNGGAGFVTLTPRQPILPTPYAMHAQFAGNIEPGASVSFSGPVSFDYAQGQPFYLGPGVTNLVINLNAQYLAGKDGGQYWTLGGNDGQVASSYVLGTLDNNALELKANGSRGLRIEPTSFGINFIAGNSNNTIAPSSTISAIGGGAFNTIESMAFGSVIAGGDLNVIHTGAGESTISGGLQNRVGTNSFRSVIAGGQFNRIGTNAILSTISGGRNNRITNNAAGSVIGGGRFNVIDTGSENAVIAGGSNNVIGAGSLMAVISGGWDNSIGSSPYGSTISGGLGNRIGDLNFQSVIGGGYYNRIHDFGGTAVIDGGQNNSIMSDANYSVIGGGLQNTISNASTYATVGGGYGNVASGTSATVPGGYYNRASAPYSFAAGFEARALHEGSFVWSEPPIDIFQFNFGAESTAPNQFVIRSSGGVQLTFDTSIYCGYELRQHLNLWGTNYGIGVQANSLYFRCNGGAPNDGFIWYKGGQHANGYADAGGGTELMHLGSFGLYVNGTFVSASDRNAKENFKSVDARAVLDKVAALPLSEWNYKNDTSARHVGPMAQDFFAAFGVGPDDKHIATVDADGVALAAIQGLNQKLEEQRADNMELKREVAELKKLVLKLTEGH